MISKSKILGFIGYGILINELQVEKNSCQVFGKDSLVLGTCLNQVPRLLARFGLELICKPEK